MQSLTRLPLAMMQSAISKQSHLQKTTEQAQNKGACYIKTYPTPLETLWWLTLPPISARANPHNM